MYKNFKVIQDNWRAIGPVSKTRYNDTWKTYHHHVERFYDLLHLSNDFRDLDFKHNLEEKIKIIEKAEALVELKDVNESFKELQDLHKVWKEDIGPVSKEMREDIWQKFSAATKKIHDKRHDHFRQMRSQYQVIIDEKLSIIEAINVYDTSKNSSHNDWQKSIKDVESLRQQYFNAGKLPYSKSEEVWQKFKTVTKKFNSAKNVFYKDEKSDQQNNLKKKIALIEFAETLKDSEDWELATNALKKVQSDWKKIGHVPRKFSDDIWKRFKSACNHYFDRYHQQKNSISQVQQQVVDTKKEFLESLKSIESSSKEIVLEAISKWRGLGNLPRNARHIDGKFNKQIDKMLEGLSLDKKEISMLKFTNVVDGYALDNDVRKLDSEQMFVRKKIDETVREMQQLENNLGFFSNAKDDNPLVMNVKARVNEFKEDLVIWKSKLAYIKNLDY
jgi:cell division protein ZapA (FtsZ GTPase activity inhibitor)